MGSIDPIEAQIGDSLPSGPDPTALMAGRGSRQRVPLVIALVVAMLVPLVGGSAIAGGWAWYRFGSASAAVAFLRGHPLLLTPRAFDLGTVPVGEHRTLKIRACNLTRGAISINGINSFCGMDGCVQALGRFPIEIEPWGTRELALQVKAPEKAREDRFRIVTHAYTAVGNPEIACSGRVTDDEASTRP